MQNSLRTVQDHLSAIRKCSLCPEMVGNPVVGLPVRSKILLIGQAPGTREAEFGKPFAWTAGRTLFSWFESLGWTEQQVRSRIYFSAVCRCFPGKSKIGGGDRVPTTEEIANCSKWLKKELRLLNPELIIPIGKLAIYQVLGSQLSSSARLQQIIGRLFALQVNDQNMDVIPLPHPSGASPWHRIEPGKSLTKRALRILGKHPAFTATAR